MRLRLDKPWEELTPALVEGLSGQLGVYAISDKAGETLFIGFAGGRSLFGLRGELQREMAARGPGHRFRLEVNMQYQSRWRELLMLHQADHGALPPENAANPPRKLGRLWGR